MVSTKVQEKEGRSRVYSTTIPRALAEAIDLKKGDEVEWNLRAGGLLIHKK